MMCNMSEVGRPTEVDSQDYRYIYIYIYIFIFWVLKST